MHRGLSCCGTVTLALHDALAERRGRSEIDFALYGSRVRSSELLYGLPVNVFAMPNLEDRDVLFRVVYRVDDPVISLSNAIAVVITR